jgi:hypothetical protein
MQYRKKQVPMKYRKKMNMLTGKATGSGMFKHQDTRYVKWLKEQLDRNETREKLTSYQNDIRQANERANYKNPVDRMMGEVQRDNLNHNSLEHLQKQINLFKHLKFA